LVPTVAVAAIAGTVIKGFPSNNQADVTASHQLLTSPAPLSSLVKGSTSPAVGQGIVLAPASGQDDVITSINVSTAVLASGLSEVVVFLDGNTTCNAPNGAGFVPLFHDFESTVSTRSYTFPSGIAVTNGQSLCATDLDTGASMEVAAWGYSVPAGTASG
jgi:hypothetical protein